MPVATVIAITIPVVVAILIATVSAAAKLAFDIHDAALALAEVIERRIHPLAVAGFASRGERVIAGVYVAAGLHIRALRRATVFIARELPFHIRDIAHAAVCIIQRRTNPSALAVLAFGLQIIVTNFDALAGVAISAGRNILGRAGKNHGKGKNCQSDVAYHFSPPDSFDNGTPYSLAQIFALSFQCRVYPNQLTF